VLSYVAHVVAQHSIAVVQARQLLPRWDLATHLVLGWNDYHLLVTARIHRLLWDLWLQGYWPPVHSFYQVPFYLVLGGGMSAGLWSSLVAFVFAGITGSAVLWRQWRRGALLPASIFLALLMSSPYLLAYASVTMTETLGAFTQLVVVLCYVRYRQESSRRTARAFAVSLTILFFTKYNYFFLLVVPLVLCEWIERTAGDSTATRLATLGRWLRRVLSSPTGILLALYMAGLLFIFRTGGFDFHALGRRISVHTIGNSGHVVLYLLLARLWYRHRRGLIDWGRISAADLRVRPLLVWFAVPVTIWLASPYPNHIRDFGNLVFNRPLGESTVGGGIATYLDVLRFSYFYSQWLLAFVVVAFAIAAARYRQQPSWMRWLIVAIPMQFAAIAFHQTRFPRFLLLSVVLLCLAAASEAGRWFASSSRGRLAGTLVAPLILALGVLGARAVVTQDRFRDVAFENYTDSASLRGALGSIRAELAADDRLAIVGEGNEVSPALLRWELGPPAGLACFPFQIGGASRLDPSLATRILLMEPVGTGPGPLDVTSYYLAQRRTVLERADRGELALRRDIRLDDMHALLRLYDRTTPPARLVACE
jgi:hypothetical protein